MLALSSFCRRAAVALLVAALAGCASEAPPERGAGPGGEGAPPKEMAKNKDAKNKDKNQKEMDCPPVRIDRDTARLVQFRDGRGQDITDTRLTAEIIDYSGDCGWDKDKRVLDVKMKVLFSLTRGPAQSGVAGHFDYFVAVPAFYPADSAKQILGVDFEFPDKGNVTTIQVRDEEVTLRLPVAEGKKANDLPIYVGFQLTPEQLSYNRRQRLR